MSSDSGFPTVVFVHGAWNSHKCWAAVRSLSTEQGVPSKAVDLASVDRGDGQVGDMYDDAAVIRSAVESVDGPVVVVAHSYGGVPATEALVGLPNVLKIIYVAAFLLDEGQSLLGALGGTVPGSWKVSADGSRVELHDPANVLFNDCDPSEVPTLVSELLPHNRLAFEQPLRGAAWKEIPSHYIISENDHAIPPAVQEKLAKRASSASTLPSGHTPFLSRPKQLVDRLREVMSADE